MITAQILTPWAGAGTMENPNRPKLADDYSLFSWTDATGQAAANIPPTPNLFAVQVVCTEEVLAAIEADSNYHILWSA